jgi:peptidoglycan/xylan/chitin deacetylase (PgdA/CDA1 family)
MRATIAVHAAACLLLVYPGNWPLSLALVAMNHLLLTALGLWPRSTLLGPNHTRLSASATAARQVAITIDDGPDPEVTPRVLDLLDRHAGKATFFCVGRRVAEHAALAREIVSRGHHIENHTQRHLYSFSLLGPNGMTREITQAQETITAVTGVRPRYFRAPAGLRNPFLDLILVKQHLQLVSWTRRGFDTVQTDAAAILARLTRGLGGGDILLLHDGHAARAADGTPLILMVLPDLLAAIADARLSTVTLETGLDAREGLIA